MVKKTVGGKTFSFIGEDRFTAQKNEIKVDGKISTIFYNSDAKQKGFWCTYQGKRIFFTVPVNIVNWLLQIDIDYRKKEAENAETERVNEMSPEMKEIYAEILRLNKEQSTYTSLEDSGIRMSIDAQIRPLRKKLQQICDHKKMTKVEREIYTQDARKKIILVESCPICGLNREKTKYEQPLSEKVIQR
jgi:hypothetical protein